MKIMIVGAVHRSGMSTKKDPNGRPYDFSVILGLRAVRDSSNSKMTVSGAGFEVTDIACKAEVVKKLKSDGVQFPCWAELTITNEYTDFGSLAAVCTEVKPIPAAAARAA